MFGVEGLSVSVFRVLSLGFECVRVSGLEFRVKLETFR